jgi:hypothetical protein
MPEMEIERLAITINRAMTMQGRTFHTPEHIFDLADPSNPHITLAALFHDLVYLNVDRAFPPGLGEIVASSIVTEGDRLSLRADVDPKDGELRCCLLVFGYQPGEVLPAAGGMNEFLSALVMNRTLGAVVHAGDLMLATGCIEATVPFRRPDPQGVGVVELLERRMHRCNRDMGLGVAPDRIELAAVWAVTLANRDVVNFSDAEVSRFLDNTWRLLPETNPSLRTPGIYTVRSYRVALQRMEEFLRSLDPHLIYGRHRGVPSEDVYGLMVERAERNVLTAREYLGIKLLAAAILEALAELSGGDAPMALFMGDIADRAAGGRLEHRLPLRRDPSDGRAEDTLQELLAVGRAGVSSFDLHNSPLALYVYRSLGTSLLQPLLEGARRMFGGHQDARAFLDSLPSAMVAPIADGCAEMTHSRWEVLRAYAQARVSTDPSAPLPRS